MNYININPGISIGWRQPFTIMMEGRIFFLTHDQRFGEVSWNMFMDDQVLKEKVEETLKNYLTNQ